MKKPKQIKKTKFTEDEKELKEFNEAKKSRAFGKSKFSRRTNNNLVYNLPELKGVLN